MNRNSYHPFSIERMMILNLGNAYQLLTAGADNCWKPRRLLLRRKGGSYYMIRCRHSIWISSGVLRHSNVACLRLIPNSPSTTPKNNVTRIIEWPAILVCDNCCEFGQVCQLIRKGIKTLHYQSAQDVHVVEHECIHTHVKGAQFRQVLTITAKGEDRTFKHSADTTTECILTEYEWCERRHV